MPMCCCGWYYHVHEDSSADNANVLLDHDDADVEP